MMQSSDESPVATRGDLPMLNYGMSVTPKATWIRRATVAAVVLAGLATAYILIGPAARRVWRRAGERSQQREAMVYAIPSKMIGYSDDLSGATEITIPMTWWAGLGPVSPLLFADPLFIHGRCAKGGPERLVVVAVDGPFGIARDPTSPRTWSAKWHRHPIDWLVIRPATLWSDAVILSDGTWEDKSLNHGTPRPLTIYAGQFSNVDASRFTISYQTSAGTFALDGRLGIDDRIVFASRPATPNKDLLP